MAAAGDASFDGWLSEDGRWMLFFYDDPSTLVAGTTDGNSGADAMVSGNLRPVASFNATPTEGTAPLSVSFDGSASSDGDGGVASHTWDFGDAGRHGRGGEPHLRRSRHVPGGADRGRPGGRPATASRERVVAGAGVEARTRSSAACRSGRAGSAPRPAAPACSRPRG